MAKPNNMQNHRYRMPPGIWCKRNTTIKSRTRCPTTSGMKTQSPNRTCMSYRQSNKNNCP
ncbi:hypothetical protein L873DRAFT_1820897 [Choiromyces venosus 120613-1]|uniref:Uncharacterized protein n=1 Tax=Choiromyces venosus 120613-1 TaxID=1336337 RepID=A0A3N4J281_9PEZI|nr:hypothetical protein L873DRAFT_1820897 [Choiromyces venosus 120613-1]